MVDSTFYNRVMFQAVSGGTGNFVVSAATLGYSTPAQRGVANGATVSYTAESLDKTQWETGTGVYTSGTVTIARSNVRESTNGGALVNFTLPPIVFLDYQAQDIQPSPYVYVSDFGAKADGSDDTAALNAAFASLVGTSGTVVFDLPGYYTTTGTVVVGQLAGSGVTSFISIECPYGQASSGIKYTGPINTAAVVFAKNKYARIAGLSVNNFTGIAGCTGIVLGGDTSGFGTQTLSLTFDSCLVERFDIGISAGGNSGAASEITFNGLQLNNCAVGFTITDFNSLDFNFNMLSLSGNTIGLDTGAASGFNVFGGSASFSSVADFQIGANSNFTTIKGFRTETSGALVKGDGAGGAVEIDSCYSVQAVAPDFFDVTGAFSRLTVRNCHLNGYVNSTSEFSSFITMTDNVLDRWDTTRNLPLLIPTNQVLRIEAFFRNNIDGGFPVVPISDLCGTIGARYDGAVTTRVFYEPCVTVMPVDVSGNPTIGVGYLALSHVRQLAEGTILGATAGTVPTPGKNLRVSGVFATAATVAFTFKRNLTTNGVGGPVVAATAGTFLPTDVGKPLKIIAGADTGADWYGYITEYLTPTTVNVFPSSAATPGGRYPNGAGKAAVVGEDEPDANYFVVGLVGDANETFWITAIATTGFTINSSNATSTATVYALIVR